MAKGGTFTHVNEAILPLNVLIAIPAIIRKFKRQGINVKALRTGIDLLPHTAIITAHIVGIIIINGNKVPPILSLRFVIRQMPESSIFNTSTSWIPGQVWNDRIRKKTFITRR